MSEKRQFIGLPPKLTKEQEEKLKNEAFNWLMNGGGNTHEIHDKTI